MAKQRQPEPGVVVDQPYVSERLRIEREWDARCPEFKHVWKRIDSSADDLKRIGAERVVDDDGKGIDDGRQMLCRVPKSRWDRLIGEPQQRSLRRMQEISANFDGSRAISGPLKKYRKPKSPSDAQGDRV